MVNGLQPFSFNPPVGLMGFDRQVDPTIIKIACSTPFSREQIAPCAEKVVALGGLRSDSYILEMPAVHTECSLRFTGSIEAATRAVNMVALGQKKSKKEWHEHSITIERPGEADVVARLRVNKDKNDRSVRTEIITKRTLEFFREEYPNQSFESAPRESGIITTNWVRVARVQVEDRHSQQLQWWDSNLVRAGISKAAVAAHFSAFYGDGGGQWS